MKKTIAIIYGGEGLEHHISVKSALNIINALDKNLYTPLPIYIDHDGNWFIVESGKERRLTQTYPAFSDGGGGFQTPSGILKCDLAIIALHGDYGEDGIIQGAIQAAKIKSLSQTVLASALTNDKAACKAVADSLGIPSAKWVLLTDGNSQLAKSNAEEVLKYPMFLKSTSLGSSFGVCKVENKRDFLEAHDKIRKSCGPRIIAEEYVRCDFELECAYLDFGEEYYIPNGVVHANGRVYSFEEKYSEKSSFSPEISAVSDAVREKAVTYSKKLCRAIGIKYISRFDFFVSGERVIFNEINTFPGMTDTSLYPRLLEYGVAPFGECLTRLIEYALSDARNI